MRGIGEHTPPARHQDEPPDNTGVYGDAQVRNWLMTGVPVHPEIAREIAAWYHTPADGDTFSAFSHIGAVTDGLVEAINEEHHAADDVGQLTALSALKAYVEACPPWRGVGRHIPPDQFQDQPADRTSDHVMEQAYEWEATGLEVHPESAREIAAWFQHPGHSGVALALFASIGEITAGNGEDEGLLDAVNSARTDVKDDGQMVALGALKAYVKACPADQGL